MIKKIANFIFELGHLRRIKHEGWRLVGVDRPDSVAEHSLRAVQIAYFLARMEKFDDPCRVAAMVAFHDCGECRVGDIHKVANCYIDVDEAGAVKEQTAELGEIGEDILAMWQEIEEQSSVAGVIGKDADYLEQAFMAKEYQELGYRTERWIESVEESLQTESAKQMLKELKEMDSNSWWQGLKKMH